MCVDGILFVPLTMDSYRLTPGSTAAVDVGVRICGCANPSLSPRLEFFGGIFLAGACADSVSFSEELPDCFPERLTRLPFPPTVSGQGC